MWGLVAIAGIAWLAYTTYLEHLRKTGQSGGAPAGLRALEARLQALEDERDRLRARVEALEAIVTDDGFDLARDARQAGVAAPRVALDALGEAPDASEEDSPGALRRGRARA